MAEFQRNEIFALASALSCMIFEARSVSRRWITVTCDASLDRYSASSSAVSPPPTMATGRFRKKKPSQVAQVLTPRPINFISDGRPSSLAEAPVETITVRARITWPLSRVNANGRDEKSTRSTSPLRNAVPKCSAWARMSAINCGPITPSRCPGQFSTIVVMVSCPPGCNPSMTSGCRLARAVYSAAVRPAGPDPMITTSCRSLLMVDTLFPKRPRRYM